MKANYKIVDTHEKLRELDRELMDGTNARYPMLSFDTETNGLLFYRSVVVGFSISTSKNDGYYIPLLVWKPDKDSLKTRSIEKVKHQIYTKGCLVDIWTGKEYPEDVDPDHYQAPDFIKKYMNKWLTSTFLIMHNAPFDCLVTFYNMGIDLTQNLFCCTLLLWHFIDESIPHGLKDLVKMYQNKLGIDANKLANKEQKELTGSIIKNGGKKGQVWRGDLKYVGTYACADTAMTWGIYEIGVERLINEFREDQVRLFFEDEVMPVCREVVVPMRLGGIRIDVDYFESLKNELLKLTHRFEDKAQEKLNAENLLEGFEKGKSVDEAVPKKAFLERVMELEGLEYPTITQKGKTKQSLSKAATKKAREKEPHWLWDYILGEGELQYSDSKIQEIKEQLFYEREGKRYRFNLGSDYHLRWLFCDKLEHPKSSLPQTEAATSDNPIPSMSADVLKEYFLDKYDFVEDLMMFRKLSDLMSNYIKKACTLHNNGWLHMNMNQAGTSSGRFSCSGGFNLQTLPQVEELDSCEKCESKNVNVSSEGRLLAHVHCEDCGHIKKNIICYSVVKKGFIAPEGYKIVNADYASLEPRCFTYMSNDPKLKAIYKEGLDMYSKVYIDVEEEWDKYSPKKGDENFLKKQNPELRKTVKPVVLGIPYGARGPQVANLMGFKKTITDDFGRNKEVIDVKRGKQWREKYLGAYPYLWDYMENQEILASKRGYVETTIGRRRHYKYAPVIQKILDAENMDRETFLDLQRRELEKETVKEYNLSKSRLVEFAAHFDMPWSQIQEKGYWAYLKSLYKNELDNAKNFPIQGIAGHITNRGMLDTTRLFKENGIDGYVVLQVHDEICCYVREDQAERGAELLKKGMEENIFAQIVDIPMEADPIICENLKDAK